MFIIREHDKPTMKRSQSINFALATREIFSEYTEIHCATQSLWSLDISFTSA